MTDIERKHKMKFLTFRGHCINGWGYVGVGPNQLTEKYKVSCKY